MGHLQRVSGATGGRVSFFAARPWRRAAGWLALLAPFFYLTYGLANHLAATRATVPSVVFDWEQHIPFWDWTIFPYWSVNAFYGLSLFIARSRHELDRHAARLLTAQCVAVACFIVWPLHFSFGQPEATGLAGQLFAALRGFDQPFNQAPSLHIALVVILWDLYRRVVHGRVARFVMHAWALAICASVLTTYQHHFIDIPTGALLGVMCVWAWPLERRVAM
ncbi:MAG: inositol phosphorylceramide synthase, partial [Chitinophagaceae bacterium]|nr:inositol phosphorylceramide synthase [Rubrivivax sp.]